MLSVIERELYRNIMFKTRILRSWSRVSVFAKNEAAGIDLSGSWD